MFVFWGAVAVVVVACLFEDFSQGFTFCEGGSYFDALVWFFGILGDMYIILQ